LYYKLHPQQSSRTLEKNTLGQEPICSLLV
jgi:hypothetical protein